METSLSRTLADGLAMAPRLDVPTAVSRPTKAERLAAKKRHRFRLDFTNVMRCDLGLREVALIAMPKQAVPQPVEERLMRERRHPGWIARRPFEQVRWSTAGTRHVPGLVSANDR